MNKAANHPPPVPDAATRRITQGDGFKVLDGLPASPRLLKGRRDSLQLAIVGLKEGEHVVVDPQKVSLNALRMRVLKARREGGDPRLRAAPSTDQNLVVWIDPSFTPRRSTKGTPR